MLNATHTPGAHLITYRASSVRVCYLAEAYYVCALINCQSEMIYAGRHFSPAGAHRVAIIEPGAILRHGTLPNPEDVNCLQLDSGLVERAATELGHPLRRTARVLVESPDIFDHLAELETAFRPDASALEQNCRVLRCIRWLVEQTFTGASVKARTEHRAVRLVREHLTDQFRDNVTLDELASLTRLSRYHLIRVFTRDVGISPHAYQTQIRLARARQLLRTGMEGRDVAAAVGFSDQSHLIRECKRSFGVTPKAYKRRAN
jgi:AraC-like DNA-binding protein